MFQPRPIRSVLHMTARCRLARDATRRWAGCWSHNVVAPSAAGCRQTVHVVVRWGALVPRFTTAHGLT